ncbi:MAG: DUF58 domain-containing protein, partial [Gammaproteobacteria bacterium]|nr:DUF58 domain-containing protein [Gammaproteobacteria bacterium]
ADITRNALLSAHELDEIRCYARSLPRSLLQFDHVTAHPQSGDIASVYRGRGYEFDENRKYQPGDEQRLINQRLYARSGELFTRLFIEEHRPHLFILLDRRAAMRFGTRHQIKVKAAATIAACYAYQAQAMNIPVAGVMLNEQPDWLAGNDSGLHRLLEALTAPCPPPADSQPNPDLLSILRESAERIPAGSFVLLLSDFHDLAPDTAASILSRLNSKSTVHAYQIMDPSELRLPADGDYYLAMNDMAAPFRVSAGDSSLHNRYHNRMTTIQNALLQCFRLQGIPCKTCLTTETLQSCLEFDHGRQSTGT